LEIQKHEVEFLLSQTADRVFSGANNYSAKSELPQKGPKQFLNAQIVIYYSTTKRQSRAGSTKSPRIRSDAIKSLCSSVCRFRNATIKEESESDYPHALQALWKALARAEDLIQD